MLWLIERKNEEQEEDNLISLQQKIDTIKDNIKKLTNYDRSQHYVYLQPSQK
jgi:hypothetical protein